MLSKLKDQRRKVDFVLVFEEDKKDVDIEIPKVVAYIHTYIDWTIYYRKY